MRSKKKWRHTKPAPSLVLNSILRIAWSGTKYRTCHLLWDQLEQLLSQPWASVYFPPFILMQVLKITLGSFNIQCIRWCGRVDACGTMVHSGETTAGSADSGGDEHYSSRHLANLQSGTRHLEVETELGISDRYGSYWVFLPFIYVYAEDGTQAISSSVIAWTLQSQLSRPSKMRPKPTTALI